MAVTKVDWDSFFPAVAMHATAAADGVIEYQVREAARYFCRNVKVWKETLNRMSIREDVISYPLLTTEEDAVIVGPLNVQFSDGTTKVTVKPRSERDLDRSQDGWRVFGSGEKEYFCPRPDQIRISWIPDADASPGLTVQVYLMPAPDASAFPEWIYNRWHETIEMGAIGRLLRMPLEEWTDDKKGAEYLARFMMQVREDASDARDSGLSDLSTTISVGRGVYT